MEKIVNKILNGDKRAVRQFYREYSPKVRAYLSVKLAREEDIEEILQDVFLSALDSLTLFRGDSSVGTWLISIARHEVADYYRKRYIRKTVLQTSRLFDEVAQELETPEFLYKKNKIKKRFNNALSSLSKKYQDVLFYKYEMGMSVKEIASEMDMSFKATESVLYRARAAFADAYEEIGE